MSGPVEFARQAQSIEALLAASPSWDGLQQAFFPAKTADTFDPGDEMKKMLAGLYLSGHGRPILDWLFDLTSRAPYPHVGATLESAGIAAAKHEARCAVGQAIARAIVDGQALLNRNGATDAKPA